MRKRSRAVVDGVLARSSTSTDRSTDRKSAQLCRAIARSLQRTLDIDVDDDVLDGLSVVDVAAADGGLFIAVISTPALSSMDEQQRRLDAAAGLFKNALAIELARKRVPNVRFVVVPEATASADALP